MRLRLGKINKFLAVSKKLPRVLTERAFLICLALILVAVVLGGLAFYQYSFLVERKEPEVLQKPATLNEKGLQSILQVWQERQKQFDEVKLKEYHNPF